VRIQYKMTKGNLKLAYWGAGGFVDLDSAYDKGWAYNAISISFARLLIEKGNVPTNSKGTFKYFMEKWENGYQGETYSVGIGIPNIFIQNGKSVSSQNSIAQAKIIDSTLKRIQNKTLEKPENLLLSLRDPLFTRLDGFIGGDKGDAVNFIKGVSSNTACIPLFVKAFQQLNSYYGNIFNGLDYDIEEYNYSSKSKLKDPYFYSKEDLNLFATNFTPAFKNSNHGFIVTAAPTCNYTETPYYNVLGIDYMIPQCYGNYIEGKSCPQGPKGGLRGFKSWIRHDIPQDYDDYKAVNNCITNSKGTSMWDLEWDVLGNETDDMAKAVRNCCKITHGDTPGNLAECDNITTNILSKYPRYTYSNNIQKSELPSLARNLKASNIVFPEMCQSRPPPSTDPSIKGIFIQDSNLIINYKS